MTAYYTFGKGGQGGTLTLEEGSQKVVLSVPAGRLQEDGEATFGLSCKGATSIPKVEVKLQLQGTLSLRKTGAKTRIVGPPIALDETLFPA